MAMTERSVSTWRGPAFRGPFLALNTTTIALLIVGSVIPIVYVIYLSFVATRFGAGMGEFVGLENYRFVMADSTMRRSIWNTLYFSGMSVVLATIIGMMIAVLMDSRSRFKAILMLAVVLPWAIPEVVSALMWQWIFNAKWGILNGLFYVLGLTDDYIAFFSDGTLAMHVIIFAYSWKLVPFVVIIIFAALSSIPDELYESSQIDGAGPVATFFFITLPMIMPAVAVAVLFCAIWSMRAFDLIYVLTRGGPGESTFVLSYYTYWKAFQYADFGAGAAVSVILALLTFAVTLIYWRLLQRRSDYE
jgi:multiple sugar transport system permease protein